MKMCTTSNSVSCWEEIDFSIAEGHVKKLQKRIAVAYQNEEFEIVKNLQHKLIHSFYAKALAIKVVSSNKGRSTAGIDNCVWNTSKLKFNAINSLNRRGYKPVPLKRIYIPKGDGNLRPLSIPTMKDRAMQTLYKFSLEPIAEISADEHSFAYCKNRSAQDAIGYCCDILYRYPVYKWVLKIDIKSCFDEISHQWILDNIPMDKMILKKFLKCGYIDKSTYYLTDQGVPQGGTISNVICNMALDGLENLILDKCGECVRFIRYADDMLILGTDNSFLLQIVLPIIQDFLSERGLVISRKKTIVQHLKKGVVFLGYKIFEEENKVIAVPSKKSINSLLKKIEYVLSSNRYLSYQEQCKSLKTKIIGWLNYFNMVEVQSLYEVEFEILLVIYELVGKGNIAKYIQHIFESYTKNL